MRRDDLLAARSAARTLVLLTAAFAACNPKPPDETDYLQRIAAGRAEKDAYLQGSEDSPVPENRREQLLPLLYYPIDPAYSVPAVLKPPESQTTIMMPTSAGTQDPFRHVGTLEFTVKGERLSLSAFAPASARTVDRLFVPFRDLTSASETYPGGRYLDIDRTATGIYQIDFNLAYSPNCYFSPTWICPLPPRANHLRVAIEAGERIRKDEGNRPPS